MTMLSRTQRIRRTVRKMFGITSADRLSTINESVLNLNDLIFQQNKIIKNQNKISEKYFTISKNYLLGQHPQLACDILDVFDENECAHRAPALCKRASLNLYPKDISLDDYVDGKIVIFGLQKAGNTWLLSLLSDTFELPAFFNVYDPQQIGTRGIVSTHDPLTSEIWSRSDFVHAVCLVRDLRDIVLSYFHYMQTESFQHDVPKAKYPDIESFYFDWFLSRMAVAHRYETYWDEYASHGVPVVRYERLVADTRGELQRLFERWGLAYDPTKLDHAIKQNEFGSLKRKGKKIGKVQIEASHFRKGKAGTFRDELPENIVRDINNRFGATLTRWGYEL